MENKVITPISKEIKLSKVIVTLGLPASGKTTWSMEYIAHNANTIRINKDSLRLMLYGESYKPEWEDLVCTIRDLILHESLLKEHDVVVDDTNFKEDHRKRIEYIATIYDSTVEIKDFTDVPLEVCLERNRNRPNPVPEEAIRRMHDQYVKPTATNAS